MSLSSATTITGLSVLKEERLIAAETTVGKHIHHTESLLGSKYVEISIIILVLLFSLERKFSGVELNILLSSITTS